MRLRQSEGVCWKKENGLNRLPSLHFHPQSEKKNTSHHQLHMYINCMNQIASSSSSSFFFIIIIIIDIAVGRDIYIGDDTGTSVKDGHLALSTLCL